MIHQYILHSEVTPSGKSFINIISISYHLYHMFVVSKIESSGQTLSKALIKMLNFRNV